MRKRLHLLAAALCCGLFVGCEGSPPSGGEPNQPSLPPTPEEHVASKAIYDANCASCHDTSRDGAPRLGFEPAWARRIALGESVMVQNAIEGFDLMPPRGDNPDLSDAEVADVVRYMIYRAGLNIPASH